MRYPRGNGVANFRRYGAALHQCDSINQDGVARGVFPVWHAQDGGVGKPDERPRRFVWPVLYRSQVVIFICLAL